MPLPEHLTGVVTRVDLTPARPRVYALVPRIGGSSGELGPVHYIDPRDDPTPPAQTGPGGDPAAPHTHPLEAPPFPYSPGDRVLIGLLDGRPDAPVILGRLA